jgi:hypothetical protein
MSDQVVVFSHDMGSKLVLSTNDRYSMDTAAEILSWLEQEDDCSIVDSTWKTASHGNLVEVGVHVVLGSIEFVVMCSYSEIFISRARGNRRKFLELCELVQREFITDSPASSSHT